MMALVSMLVFVGAMALAWAVMWTTVAPQWRRIALLASGGVEQPFRPLATLVLAEQRIAVRRWAAAPVPAPIRQLRAA